MRRVPTEELGTEDVQRNVYMLVYARSDVKLDLGALHHRLQSNPGKVGNACLPNMAHADKGGALAAN